MSGPPEFETLRARTDGTLHILQLTDFHSDAGEAFARRTYDDIRAITAHTEPDFLAVTGDIWCGDSMPEAAPALMDRDLDFLGSLGVPWAFVWGNHDYVGDLDQSRAKIAATKNALAPVGDGRGSFRIEIRDAAGSSALWDLFFLNSGLKWKLPGDTAWFEKEALRIRKKRGCVLPALVFVHIPLYEYERARLSGAYRGIAQEEVLHWGDDGQVLAALLRHGGVRACFAGHSHVNDFSCEAQGITLAYGRATGYGGYGGDQLEKGAKSIVLDTGTNRLEFETVFASGSSWRPADGGPRRR